MANRLGIPAETPVFVSLGHKCRECGSSVAPLVYQTGYTVESQHFHAGKQIEIYAFPDLKTALAYEALSYVGYVPFTGFIAVGEAIGEHIIEPISSLTDKYTRSEKIRVIGMRAFIAESEIKEGYLQEVSGCLRDPVLHYLGVDPYLNYLDIIPREEQSALGIDYRLRYAFRITQSAEVLFSIANAGQFMDGDKGDLQGFF